MKFLSFAAALSAPVTAVLEVYEPRVSFMAVEQSSASRYNLVG